MLSNAARAGVRNDTTIDSSSEIEKEDEQP